MFAKKTSFPCKSHQYQTVSTVLEEKTFEASTCMNCYEHKLITAIRKFLKL